MKNIDETNIPSNPRQDIEDFIQNEIISPAAGRSGDISKIEDEQSTQFTKSDIIEDGS